MKQKNIVEITLTLPIGNGTSNSTSSCLFRPFLKLVQTGKPIGKINYVFYRHVNGKYYNLGSLCHSEGKRILFFPGFHQKNLLSLVNKKGNIKKFNLSNYVVDHFTIEKNFNKMHLTLLHKIQNRERKHPVSFPTLVVNDHVKFWFGLSIQVPELLEPTCKESIFSFSSPKSDSERRIKNIMDARKKAVFHIVELSDKSNFSENEFLNFNFFICSKNFMVPKESAFLSLPRKEPAVSGFKSTTLIPYRSHYVSLQGITKKIGVLVSRHIGHINSEIFISCYEG